MSFTDFNDMLFDRDPAEARDLIRSIVKEGIAQAGHQLTKGGGTITVELGGDELMAEEAARRLVKRVNEEKGKESASTPPEAAHGAEEIPWRELLQCSDNGSIKSMVSNIVLILSHDEHFKGALAYCDLSYRILKRRALLPHMHEGEWTDADTSHVLNYLGIEYSFDPPKAKVQEALVVVAQHHRFHPVREYLNSLVWDGEPRLENWLVDVFEARPKNENTGNGFEYLMLAGRFFLIGAVARVMNPPVKMDNVLILEGQQGEGKSTALSVLFSDPWFNDSPIPIGDKDAYQNIQGTWCNELGELDSFNKAESTASKLFFSAKSDRYRPSYGTTAQTFHRQCVFTGTTNQDEYLKDYTGNRRYWPVYCMEVNIKLLSEIRDQLWAEAMHFYNKGLNKPEREPDERWWPDREQQEKLFNAEQDSRLQVDPWQHLIEDYLYSLDKTQEYVTSIDVLLNSRCKDNNVSRADQNRLSPIMHALGWKNKKKRIHIDGCLTSHPRHVYVRPDNWNTAEGENAPD